MIEIFDDTAALAKAAADKIVHAAQQAVAARGRFLLTLSGGHSPQPLYRLLAQPPYRDRIPWDKTTVLWSDERYVPINDERSNAGMARRLMLDHLTLDNDRIFPMFLDGKSAEEAAVEYEALLKRISGTDPVTLDFVLLGCGSDGHTASLFPGDTQPDDSERLIRAAQSPKGDLARITMTPRLLNQSRAILFLAYGEEKATVVHDILQGENQPDRLPAQAIKPHHGELYWFMDKAAASLLQ